MNPNPALECHPASERERIEAYENVFDVWPHGETREKHLANRLRSVQHSRARWFVGCLGDRVVTSLGCYPMRFHVGKQILPGIAIGAVHTVPGCRGRGYAAQLLDWVENFQAQHNAHLSLLFSDIPTEYYARLGYKECPSWCGWLDVAQPALPPSSDLKLSELNPRTEIPNLLHTYTNLHQGLPLAIARDLDYWEYLIRKGADFHYYWVENPTNQREGYVCLNRIGRCLRIQEIAVGEEDHRRLVPALVELAQFAGCDKLGGWLPNTPGLRERFSFVPRQMEMTMLKALGEEIMIDLEMRQAAGRISETDHV